MNIIEMVNDIAKNLVQFSEEIKGNRGSLTDEQIDGTLAETKADVLEECQKMTGVIIDIIDGVSKLSELKQEQIKILVEKATKEESNIAEVEDALNSLLRLAEAADKDLNINYFRGLFIEMFELIIILIINIKPNQSEDLTKILQKLR